MLQSTTFDKSDGVLLQNNLVKHFQKDPLLLVAGLVDFVRGVSWFGASPLAHGLLCSYGVGPHPASPLIRVLGVVMPVTNGALIERGFPQLLRRLPAIPSRPREGVVAAKQACKQFLEGELT